MGKRRDRAGTRFRWCAGPAPDDLFDLGDIIKTLRPRKEIRGDRIPEALGVNKGTLSRIERTSKYDPATLDRIAAGLGVTATELLTMRDALRKGDGKTLVYCATHDDLHGKVEVVLHLNEGFLSCYRFVTIRSPVGSSRVNP
jgi:transcriptional regulator with XRE-family HTH domain